MLCSQEARRQRVAAARMTRAEFSSLYLQSNPGVDYTPLGPKLERRRVANLCGMTGQLEASGLAHALASTPTHTQSIPHPL